MRSAAVSRGESRQMPGQPITNALTIDVEDYFQVSALAPYIPRDQWHLRECRVERNVERILLMLEEQQTRATFFTLGWIAERYPHLVRCIVDAGHELASHGYGHQRASDLNEADFSADVGRAKKLLEDLSGQQVRGYRAPSFSIGEANLWAFRLSPARPVTATVRASIRFAMITTVCRMRHASRIGCAAACSNCR
jgi:polysaccharide deacetylase family protein (PEP-CTERM system associated)